MKKQLKLIVCLMLCAIILLSACLIEHNTEHNCIGENCQNCFPDCLTNVPFIIKPPKNISIDKGINENLAELTDLTVPDCNFKLSVI